MPAYNGELFIKQAIESVLVQTYPDWELIVIDDGSTDKTAQLVLNFRDARIVYVRQENRGQAAALNHGLDIVRGEYVTTLDVDDWFTPNSLGDRAFFLDSYQRYDVVYGDGIFCDINGNQLRRFSELRTGDVSGDVFDIMLSNSFFGTGANIMIRTSTLEKYNLRYDETIVWCQDYDLYLRLAEKCQFGYVDIPTVWYRLHTANMTMVMSSDRRKESLVRVKRKVLASPRFAKTKLSHKLDFFLQLLLYDLVNWTDQLELMNHPHFRGLPTRHRARVLRLLASEYLIIRKNPKEVKSLLAKSFTLNPLDARTWFVLALSYFNRGPVEWIFNYWRKMKLQKSIYYSPFENIKE
jgi:glycosyltransferase involved in cell wall biosynthesis